MLAWKEHYLWIVTYPPISQYETIRIQKFNLSSKNHEKYPRLVAKKSKIHPLEAPLHRDFDTYFERGPLGAQENQKKLTTFGHPKNRNFTFCKNFFFEKNQKSPLLAKTSSVGVILVPEYESDIGLAVIGFNFP